MPRLAKTVLCIGLGVLASTATARGNSDEAQRVEEAKIHYQAGKSYFDRGDYASAKREFLESYQLSHRGPLLFNIGLCEEKLGEYQAAIETLRRYLGVPESKPDVPLVEEKLKRLERLVVEPREGAAAAGGVGEPSRPAAATPTGPPAPRVRTWGFVVIGLGGASFAAALGTGLAAHAQYKDLEQKCGEGGKRCPNDFTAARDSGRTLGLATDVLLGVGAAAVVVGTIVVLVKERPPKVALLPLLGPTLVGVTGEVHF